MALRVPIEHRDCLTFRKQQLEPSGINMSSGAQLSLECWWNTVRSNGGSEPTSTGFYFNSTPTHFLEEKQRLPAQEVEHSCRICALSRSWRKETALRHTHFYQSSVWMCSSWIIHHTAAPARCCALQQLRLSHQLRYTACRQFGSIRWSFRVSVIKKFTLAPLLLGFPNVFFFCCLMYVFRKKK